MIPDSVISCIAVWARKRDRKSADALTFLAISYIKDNMIDWNTESGKNKVVSFVEDIYYGKTRKDVSFKEDWIGHQTNKNPFEISLEDIFPVEANDDIDNDDRILPTDYSLQDTPKKHEEDSENNHHRPEIDTLPIPFEVKEILKDLDDKAYKSPILSNLDNIGRLKLIRKAKILIYLQKQTGKE
jgi:hypothetical protein